MPPPLKLNRRSRRDQGLPGDADLPVAPRLTDDADLTRRSFIAANAVALGLPAFALAAAPVAHLDREPFHLTLFAPTGPYATGTVQLHLVDHSRPDPWVPSRRRELMISIWYPATGAGGDPLAPWIQHAAGELFLRQLIGSLPTTGGRTPPGGKPPTTALPGVQLPITQARQGAPVRSPFVLNELATLASGANPDIDHRTLPAGLSQALDLTKIGMFGHSLGGTTAAKAMAADTRIRAGVNLDGSLFLENPSLHQNITSSARNSPYSWATARS